MADFPQNVVLRPAYAWDCEDCGRENFSRALTPEFSDEELAELLDDYGVEAWEQGQFVTMPKSVTCSHCGAEFNAVHCLDDG